MKGSIIYLYAFVSLLIAFSACRNTGNTKELQTSDAHAGWEMGIALYSFHNDPFSTALEKADSADIKVVEGFSFHKLGDGFDQHTMADLSQKEITLMKQMLDEKGMKMKSMYVGKAENEAGWKYYFDIAKEFGMEYLVSEPPLEQLDMLDSLAGIYQIKIAIHEHAKGKSIYWHPDSVLAAINDRPNLGVCADLGHWVRSGLDPVECLAKLENHILGVHLKDAEESGNLTSGFVTVGTGVIDFPAIVTELERQRFNGLIHVECEHHTNDNLHYVIQDLKIFNELTRQTEE